MTVTLKEILSLGLGLQVKAERDTGGLVLRDLSLPHEAEQGALAWLRPGVELDVFGGTALLMKRGEHAPAVVHEAPFAILSCKDPRRAMALVIQQFFSSLIGSGPIDVQPGASVHPSAVLGPHGQGYIWVDDDGSRRWEKFPQVGGIEVEAGVEIGPCSTVMCAAIGMTRIREGARIGNGVNIGHGVQVGENALLSAHVTVGGCAEIGPRAILWQNVAVAHGVVIGADAVVGMGSTVIRDVPAGETWAGNPARPIGRGEGI